MAEPSETTGVRLLKRLPDAALCAVALLLVAAATRRIWGADFWWQWATGRWVSEHGIPHLDVFSYTAAGRPWIEMRWLYCWALFRWTSALGFPAAVVAKVVALLAAFGLVTRSVLERNGRAVAALALSVAVLASTQRFYVRPEIFTYLMFAVFVWVLERHRRRGGRWVWALPALQVVWTNSHTEFVLGPCLVGLAFAVGAGRWLLARRSEPERGAELRRGVRTLGIVLALTAAACLVNPYGAAGALFPFQLFAELRGSAFKDAISEFRGPFTFGTGWVALRYYEALIALCAVSVAVNLRRLDPFRTLLVASQLYLSILAIRNLPLFALAAVPFVIDNFQRARWPRPDGATRRRAAVLASSAVILLCAWQTWALVTDRFNVEQGDTNQFGVGIAASRYPEGAVRFLTEHHLDGRIFHSMRAGAYLISRGYPVYIDPRLEVYGETAFGTYLSALRDPAIWQREMERWKVETLLLEPGAGAVEFALRSGRWLPVYADETSIVFVSTTSSSGLASLVGSVAAASAVAGVRERLPEVAVGANRSPWRKVRSPAPYEAFAGLLLELGRIREARPFVSDAARLSPDPSSDLARLATLDAMLGTRSASAPKAEPVVGAKPESTEALLQLAARKAGAGDLGGARSILERSVAADPKSVTAWAYLGKVCGALGDVDAAQASLERAIQLAPDDARHRANLGRILINAGHVQPGEARLEEALRLTPGDPALYRDLAATKASQGEFAAARDLVRRGLAVAPGNPELLAIARNLVGR